MEWVQERTTENNWRQCRNNFVEDFNVKRGKEMERKLWKDVKLKGFYLVKEIVQPCHVLVR